MGFGIERPLGFTQNGELLLVANNEQVVLYNFVSQETKNVEVRELSDSFNAPQARVYVKGLVSVTGGNVFHY